MATSEFKAKCQELGLTETQGRQILNNGWRAYPGTAMHQGSARALKWRGFLSEGGTQLTEQGIEARNILNELKDN